MSDSLKERLNSHSDAFKGLLSLIPAKYYYDDDSKNQWNRKKGTKNDALRAKQAKFDPSSGSSALDEVNRRETDALINGGSTSEEGLESEGQGDEESASESEISVIFDDHGNEIILSGREQSESEEEDAPVPDATPSVLKTAKAKKDVPVAKTAKKQTEKPSASEPADGSKAKAAPKRDIQGIEELRKRLADKINELKVKRKAPGTNAPGAPKNREELLAARKQRQDTKKRKWDDAGAESDNENAEGAHDEVLSNEEKILNGEHAETIIFGQIKLGDGNTLGRDMTASEEKKLKKRNAADQLRVLESRKAKVGALSEEKQKEIAGRAQWSRAILQSEGAKVRDNEKLLKKTVKQQNKRKMKSEREWKDRLDNVAKGIAAREAKRNANLAARKEAKGSKGKKKKPKRAGFEGKKRRK